MPTSIPAAPFAMVCARRWQLRQSIQGKFAKGPGAGFKNKALSGHIPSLIALLKISGDLGDISLQHHLLDRIDKTHPPHLRRAALQSIALLHYTGEQRARLASKLLPLMFESDLADLAEPALEALRQAHLGTDYQAQLKKLLHSPSSRIREFAMQALAAQGTTRTLHDLIGCLDSTDRSVREEALGALSRAPSAAGVLCERLLEQQGGEAAFETAKALAPQAGKIPHRMLQSLANQYVSLFSNGSKKSDMENVRKADEKRRAILNVFRASNSPELVDAVFESAKKLRQSDEAQKAYQALKEVSGLNGWNDQIRIELALAGLNFGPRDLTRSARSNDLNLRILEDILSTGRTAPKDLAKVINRDTSLNRRAQHYVGFHFVERMANDRQLAQVLEHLAESRSEEGRLAKEKLGIEGLIEVKSKTGILEERAKVMMAASDMIAAEAIRQENLERERTKSAKKNGHRTAKAPQNQKRARSRRAW